MWLVPGDVLVGYEARRKVVDRREGSVARPASLLQHGDVVTARFVADSQ